ncbi:ribonuclease P protein subunit p40-like isoform X2 [Acanthochromis polyacanthus]|uniref:ribonuclease P protein subunit p40 isoform X2 n=1 Tax=Acanthochromis polyacanthus TaxID=80966 RepID=UPI0022342AD0|nr:ribonuclease P protein subunit p40 isoform X2 [Acanthochromis polyacanthus]XP_051809833.1 ribonuclease P protein subunit p40-like isoform X2 [Acanthochromis polyacanthus]
MSVDLDRTPRNLLLCERSSLLDQKNRLSAQVQQLHFGYKVSVLLPECSSAPSHLDSVLNSFSSFYLIRKLPIYELLDSDFLQKAVYPGGVYGLSYRTRIDEDNCVALMPNVVSVDLTDSSMATGGRGYMRLLTGLKSRLRLQTDFLLSHHPGGGACLQPLLSRYDWSEHTPEVSHCHLTHLSCPAPRSCDPHGLLEWLGAVDADVSREDPSSSFLSSLTCPDPKTRLGGALRVSVCGLLLPPDVQRLIQELRRYLEQPLLESWVSLTVHGFVDSPVSWGDGKHGVLRGGDNFYNLLLFQDHTYQLHLATGAHDTCPP